MANTTGVLEAGDADERNAVLIGINEAAEEMTRSRTRCGYATSDPIVKLRVGHRRLNGVDYVPRAEKTGHVEKKSGIWGML